MKIDTAFAQIIEDFEKVNSRRDGKLMLRRIADLYGLQHAVYFAARLPELTRRDPYIATTYSADWIEHYRDQDFVRIDPVLPAGLQRMLPTDWGGFDRKRKDLKKFFGEAVDFGVGQKGMTFPIRGAGGEAAMFSITSDATDHEWAGIKSHYMRDFQTIAHFVHEMVIRTEKVRLEGVRLSPRESECLKWAAEGKTYIDIATILSISERTVRFYLDTARHKLNAINITHAVARAVASNIINLPG
ncbi:LuxR family transcriptional regulator [Breoghania sp. JC706]|uniref:LuxR family transcriptional regulator n=1 Tax=Breoghania sp. JC706 TaxID=3117732 RepID=UPI003007F287